MDGNPSVEINTAAAARPRVSVSNFALEIDGQTAGYVHAVEGGEATGQVVALRESSESVARKHIGAVNYEDVTVTVDLSLDPVFFTWITDTLQQKNLRRDVTVLTLDADLKVRRQDDYYNALITAVTVPKMDGSSKDAGYFIVKFSPEYARNKKGDESKYKAAVGPKRKMWLVSNFRLQIDGLDCSKVHSIDSFTIKQVITDEAVGEHRNIAREPAHVEIPNLCITLTEAAAQTFFDWHDDFVIKGNNSSDYEKSGTLTFLTPDLKTTLGEIRFTNLGIFRLSGGKREANSEQPRRVKAELYVEQMRLDVGSKP